MKTILLLLLFNIGYCQSSIVAAGNANETFGAGLVELQIEVKKEVSLGVPKFEIPIETPKPKVKKLTWWQKILKLFNFK